MACPVAGNRGSRRLPYLWPALSLTAVDLRGHGDSDKPEAGYTLTNYVADVWEAIGKMRLKRPPVLIGHSLGGAIVRRIAADHASELAAVVVEDSDLWGAEEAIPEQRRAFGEEWLKNVRRPLPELAQIELERNPKQSYREAMERATRVTNTADGVFLSAADGVGLAAGRHVRESPAAHHLPLPARARHTGTWAARCRKRPPPGTRS